MSGIQITAIVTLLLTLLGSVFHLGQLSARMAAIEAWRLELRGDLMAIGATLRRLEILMGGRED